MNRFRRSDAPTVIDEGPPVVEEEVAPPPPPPPRRPLLWPWLLLLLLLVAGGLTAWWLFTRDDNNGGGAAAKVVVPNVIGEQQDEAVNRVNERGLLARVATGQSDRPPGTVFAAEPGAGTQVARRSVVTLSVSAAQSVAVADVVGNRLPAAIRTLRAQGLRVRPTSVASKKPSGTVISQRPVAGESVTRGSIVVLQVSRRLVVVPDVVGQPRDAAVAAVRAAGFVPQTFRVPATQPAGTVVAQKPNAGARVLGGAPVRLNVSSGKAAGVPPPPPTGSSPSTKPATVKVPDVNGQPQSAAQRRLNSAGLKAGVVYVPSDEAQGTVVSQSPAAGLTRKRGTRIQLNVALGPNPGPLRPVPGVVGQDPATARSRLRSAGFNVQTLAQSVTNGAQVGVVVDEQPSRRSAPVRSTVTIYVGRRG